jgi:IclR family acetate operon transcriptional repressor
MELNNSRRGRPKGFAGLKPAVSIQALDRALDVLGALAASEGMTLSELATKLDQSVATMYRVLSTLERRAFVEISADRQQWYVGAGAYSIGSAFLRRTNVVERSRPIMRALMQETGETSNLGIEKDGNILFISQVETLESIRAFFPAGTLSPLHASGARPCPAPMTMRVSKCCSGTRRLSDLPKRPSLPCRSFVRNSV